MDREDALALLEAVAAGSVAPRRALARLGDGPLSGFTDLGFARPDTHRGLRTGDPEVVFGAGKTPEQAVAVVRALRAGNEGGRAILVTRVGPATREALQAAFPGAEYAGGCATIGPLPEARGTVVVVSAGTSDGPVAAEAAVTARAFGAGVEEVADVGVAGLHRLLAERERLERADCLVVVAGMEGALPSAVGGLVGTPVVAVPTSVGYGAAFAGLAALLGMLTSCAPGVAVVNIDNGFGAGVHAARVARAAAPRVPPP
ncbi:MAG: nickel pincer cofactor biosynthesis protein LarB [Mycobacteriales bacterium]